MLSHKTYKTYKSHKTYKTHKPPWWIEKAPLVFKLKETLNPHRLCAPLASGCLAVRNGEAEQPNVGRRRVKSGCGYRPMGVGAVVGAQFALHLAHELLGKGQRCVMERVIWVKSANFTFSVSVRPANWLRSMRPTSSVTR